jgi:hypothetical protein
MAVAYDEKVIIEFVGRLYRRAASMVLKCTVAGGVGGLVVALLGGAWYGARSGVARDLTAAAVVVGGIGAVLGYLVGSDRAFALRLQTQTALCQVQIERHARHARAQPPPIPR